MKRLKVYIVDDHKIFARGLASLLGNEDDFEIAGYGYDGTSTINFINQNAVDLAIIDIQMPGMNGIELCKLLKDQFPDIKILGLSMVDDAETIQQLIDAGADGYVMKDIEKSELIKAINTISSGREYYSGEVSEILLKQQENKFLLTRREKQIITLIAQEFTNAMIADKLFISEHTVESHRKNIFRKTQAKSIVGLVRFAYEHRLV